MNKLKYAWQETSLRLVLDYLHFDPEKVLTVNGDVVIQAEELLLPSVPFILVKGTPLPSWPVQSMRTIFLEQKGLNLATPPQRLYISRKHAALRRIQNEPALIHLLEEYGLQSVELETLPPQQQAELFQKARCIIGPHGSAFTNLIFADPGYILIEIDHGSDPQRSFYKGLTGLTGGVYLPFYVDHTIEDHLDEDMIVNLQSFKVFLETHLHKDE